MLSLEDKKRGEARYYERVALGSLGKTIPVSFVDDGEAGYCTQSGPICIGWEPSLIKEDSERNQIFFRGGVFYHELGHKAFTDFRLMRDVRIKYPNPMAAKIVATLFNIVEDPAVERLNTTVLGGYFVRANLYTNKKIYASTPLIETIDDAFSQYIASVICFKCGYMPKGNFTFDEVKEDYFKSIKVMRDAILDTNPRNRMGAAEEMAEITRPLWEKQAKDFEKLMQQIANIMEQLGIQSESGEGASSGPMIKRPGNAEDSESDERRNQMVSDSESGKTKYQNGEGEGKTSGENRSRSRGEKKKENGSQNGQGSSSEKNGKNSDKSGGDSSENGEQSDGETSEDGKPSDKESSEDEGKSGKEGDAKKDPKDEKGLEKGSNGKAGDESDDKSGEESNEKSEGKSQSVSVGGGTGGSSNSRGGSAAKSDCPTVTKEDLELTEEDVQDIQNIEDSQERLSRESKREEGKENPDCDPDSIDISDHFDDVDVRNEIIKDSAVTPQESASYANALKSVNGCINYMVYTLSKIFREDVGEKVKKKSGKIDIMTYYSPKITNRMCVRFKDPSNKSDIDFLEVVDESGSMGSSCKLVAQFSVALAEVAGRLHFGFASMGYTGGGYGLELRHFILWNNTRRQRYKLMSIDAIGGTPTEYAVEFGSKMLMKRQAKHKIMMVLTDGAPDSREMTRESVKRANQAGIDVIGVGIGTNDEEGFRMMFGKDYIECADATELGLKAARAITNVVKRW